MSFGRRLDYAEVHRLHGEGLSLRAIAARLGATDAAIVYALRQPAEPRPTWRDVGYWELWSQGYTVAEIARGCEVRQGVVWSALRGHGIERLQLAGTEQLKAILGRMRETQEEVEAELYRREFAQEEER